MMDIDIEYLLNFLGEELAAVGESHELRISPILPISTVRAPDLPQDYDARANKLHSTRGVQVRVDSREFFFPAEWVARKDFAQIHREAAEIRDRFSKR